MKKWKKWTALLCAGAMLISLAACGTQSAGSDSLSAYAGQSVTGQITALDGTSVTLQLGELSQSDATQPSDATPPEKPESDRSDDTAGQKDGTQQSDATPPEKPEGDATGDGAAQDAGTQPSDMTPPEKPEGDATDDGAAQDAGTQPSDATPPEKPEGDSDGAAMDGSTPPDGQMPNGTPSEQTFTAGTQTLTVDLADVTITQNDESIAFADLAVDDILTLTFDEDGTLTAAALETLSSGSAGGDQGDSATTITEDGTYTDTAYYSTGDDENALRVDGATVTLENSTVSKNGGASSNAENGDFYGVNAALLATNGAQVTIRNATITSDAQNGNGVFSYGSGTTVQISDSTITTTADNSGGLQTTGGGTTNAENLTVETSGNSSAAIRSDRGGGTVTVDGGSYTSNGYNSPAVYSTADITVQNAALTANHSEALVIEGENSITLENCDVTGNMSDTEGASSDENVHNVMIYQSMSGDANVGTAEFSMTGGSMTGKNGDLIYVTNTSCTLRLSGVTLENEDADGLLLRVAGNAATHGWGTAGSNGAQVEFAADDQVLTGDISVDAISSLQLRLCNGSTYTGAIQMVENAQGGTSADAQVNVTIESGCTWVLTGDCTITSLENNGTIDFNGYTITLADGTVLQ